MITINYHDPRPIYQQITDGFRRLIVMGVLENGQKMPSVRELAAELAINPNTIQRAYRELESEGLLASVAGKGSFVSKTKAENRDKIAAEAAKLKSAAMALQALGLGIGEIKALCAEAAQGGTEND